MPYTRREFPEFSWSHSRNEKFKECPRDYYYHYYAAHNGWEFDAPEQARLAYRLKNLTNLPLEIGAAIHEGASYSIRRVRSGSSPPSAADLYSMARGRLNRVWLNSQDFSAWERSPNRNKMFHEFYYDDGLSDNAIEQAKEQLKTCFQNLLDSESYRESVAAPRCEIKSVEQFITFNIDETQVHAVPDLVYRKGDDTWIVVDWKSGRNKGDDTVQASVYALYVREYFETPAENIKVRVEYLYHGKMEEYSFTEGDLEERTDAIKESIAAMKGYLLDADRNQPLEKDMFPMRAGISHCRFCNYYQLDRDEINKLMEGPF